MKSRKNNVILSLEHKSFIKLLLTALIVLQCIMVNSQENQSRSNPLRFLSLSIRSSRNHTARRAGHHPIWRCTLVLLRCDLYCRIRRCGCRHLPWENMFRPSHRLLHFYGCNRYRCCSQLLQPTGRNA